jgi:hypothetical protein
MRRKSRSISFEEKMRRTVVTSFVLGKRRDETRDRFGEGMLHESKRRVHSAAEKGVAERRTIERLTISWNQSDEKC